MKKCEGCGSITQDYTLVHVTNGVLCLCHQCLSDVNRKNPEVKLLRSALERILEWDCLNPRPMTELCDDFPWLKQLCQDALAGKKNW